MRAEDFTPNAPGKLVNTADGILAFVPNPLPPEFTLGWKTIKLLSEAERALGKLGGAGQKLPNPHLLIGPFLRREAILSSRIEGTITTAQELLLFEVESPNTPPTPDVQEVA